MKKKFEIEAINRALYESRNKKKITLKEAAKALKVTRLHLKLIELGYLHVSKRLQPRFINYYKLPKDFFKANTTYVSPINIKYEDPHIEEKIREKAKTKKSKLISGIISLSMITILGVGVYYFNRDKFNPRAAWSNEFTSFRQEIINKCIEEPDDDKGVRDSVEYPGDIEYFVARDNFELVIPGAESHASGAYIDFKTSTTSIRNFAYNQKKIGVFDSFYQGNEAYGVFTYTEYGNFNLPKVTVSNGEVTKDFYPGSTEYENFKNLLLKPTDGFFYQRVEEYNNSMQTLCQEHFIDFKSFMDSAQVISARNVFGFRLGFRLILIPAIILVLSASTFIYALIKGRKKKEKKIKVKPYVVHKTEYTADAALVYRSVPNDSKIPMIVPECLLRVLALVTLLLASIGTVWLTQSSITGQAVVKSFNFNAYVSNLLVTGITLAFFLKLDVYHKKNNRELLENIIVLFVFGLVFYVAEAVTYACLSSQGTIYSELIKLFSTLLPGNIIWNLMMYSLIFFFLFTLPKSIEDAPHKVLLWRLGSVIPTLLLLVAFIYQGTFQGVISPYISFLFHTSGALSTAFAIFYLYTLFFFQQYVSLKYGKDFKEVFLDSRRYALSKNVIACIIIAVLVLVDLLFFFYLPYNSLNLGNNWIIAILIPFILFYRPHIGERSPKWDLVYTLLYVVFLVGGSLISISIIANTLDLSQLQQIIS